MARKTVPKCLFELEVTEGPCWQQYHDSGNPKKLNSDVCAVILCNVHKAAKY